MSPLAVLQLLRAPAAAAAAAARAPPSLLLKLRQVLALALDPQAQVLALVP
jgi:hypothetical protein